MNLVEEGFDAAIRVGELEGSTIAPRSLAPYRLVPRAAPGYLARQGNPDRLDELRRHACLNYALSARPGPPLWRFPSGGSVVEVEPAARLEVSDSRALSDAALNGGGIILANDILHRNHLAAGRLVRVLPGYEGPSRPMHLLIAERRAQVPKLRALVDWIGEVFGCGGTRPDTQSP